MTWNGSKISSLAISTFFDVDEKIDWGYDREVSN
jgi:hypothetical protein